MEAAKLSLENRTLYHGDNLPFLCGMNSGKVHLIATDPPLNTTPARADGARFTDRWRWKQTVH